MCLNYDELTKTRVDSAPATIEPIKTASDLASFIARNNRWMDGTALESNKELRPVASDILAEAVKRLAYAIVDGSTEKVQKALIDVTFGIATAGLAFDLPFDRIVDGTVREYERREQAAKVDPFDALLTELAAALGVPVEDLR